MRRFIPIIAKMHCHLTQLALVTLAASLSAGCVWPENLNPNLITQYQSYTLAHPPRRLADDVYRPVPGTTGPALDVRAENGRTYLYLSLQEAIYRTLINNMDIKVTGYDPAISWQDVEQETSVFDWELFGSAGVQGLDRRTLTTFAGTRTKSLLFELGIRKRTTYGGQLEVAAGVTRTKTKGGGFATFNPAWEQTLEAKLTQPLLRNAGQFVNLARYRVARKNHEISMSQFRVKVLDSATAVQTLYWQLIRARRELTIQEDLLQRTIDTNEQVIARGKLDASAVQISQTEAAIEDRMVLVIQAEKVVKDIQDQLIRTMADAQVTMMDDVVVVPITEPSEVRVVIDSMSELATALRESPELEQARLAIDINDIAYRVAGNQLLPQLDLLLSTRVQGMDDGYGSSTEVFSNLDYRDYFLGLSFEYPLGNRGAKAGRAQSRLEKEKSLAALQNLADNVALAVREAVRQVDTSYVIMETQKRSVVANQRFLDAVDARQRFTAELTPEFLDLKLSAQERLATAQLNLLQALTDYNIALANLNRMTGTTLKGMGVTISDIDEDYGRALTDRVKLQQFESPVKPLGLKLPPMSPTTNVEPSGEPSIQP